jgi:hypothetical protein
MASIIRIKRSGTAASAPTPLANGELAYSAANGTQANGGDRLYIGFGAETAGNAANTYVIGGKYFTDLLDHVHGTLTANSGIIVDSNKKIDELNIDNITIDANKISSTNTNGNIELDPAGTGYVHVIGTNGLVIPVGTTAQQGPAVQGAIRYNSEISQFEGYSGANWSSLGGVRSVDGLTFITAETTPALSDDTLSFFTDGSLAMSIDTNSLDIESKIATVNINATTESTAHTNGALVVDGGVGIAGNLNVNGALTVTGGQAISGDFAINGGDLYSNVSTFNLLNKDTEASLTNDGPATVNAFLGASAVNIGAGTGTTTINHNGHVLGNFEVDGTAQIDGATTIGASGTRVATTVWGSTVSITGSNTTTMGVDAATGTAITFELKADNSVGDANLDVNVKNALTIDATAISVDSTDDSNFTVTANSAATKTLTVQVTNAGSGDANLDINVDNAVTLDSTSISLDATNTSNFTVTSNSSSNTSLTLNSVNNGAGLSSVDIGSVNTDNITLTSATKTTIGSDEVEINVTTLDVNATNVTIDATGTGNSIIATTLATTLNSDTVTIVGTAGGSNNSNVTITGELNVDNIRINGNTISSTDNSNVIYIDPAPVDDNAGTLIIKGNLQVDGTTTTINSTQITIDDPVLTLGGDIIPTTDDNLDRGIKFNWYDSTGLGSAKIGFFGYDDSASEFVFIAHATDTNSVFAPADAGVFGNVRFGKLAIADATQSTSTTTGSVIVAGGLGLAKNAYIGGIVSVGDTTEATSTTAASVVIAGGLGILKNIRTAADIIGAGAATSDIDGFNIEGGTY